MKRLLNTLYVTTPGSYLSKEGEAIEVRREDGARTLVPLLALEGVVAFGAVGASPYILGHCAEQGVSVGFLTENGRFLARVEGPVSGNVLLRRAQYRAADDPPRAAAVTRNMLAGKLANQRTVLRRHRRDHDDPGGALAVAEDGLSRALTQLDRPRDPAGAPVGEVDRLRGVEGDAAACYFAAFGVMIRRDGEEWRIRGRSRRPPLDRVNCLLSFVYTLLTHDVRGALETVGLDPQVGFLHADRPGRPSLALDLVEEFRAPFADRLVLTLINRQELSPEDFELGETGAVTLTGDARKAVLVAYQKRKKEELTHPFLNEKLPFGLMWHAQARLLARHLRGDLDAYPPFLWK
ncbi:type I-C CRISPR-associated endonuclease Cas1c [Azospirillum sp. Sh1]|uniref:type I-C CRISPR-associated endonuclease Cas1c n=1 Tax=Azospirillum sp. Sh1 TaxID=2607285 RepID=UPI0011EC4D84|nr:type I-C CRISPR-associated endonuclease Cas1c [Azospirillum sp. Sh1]KAA0578680.1 type I-C CRISPR-associated endonuclease Cas1 [Azospirillum sp. Sh1]